MLATLPPRSERWSSATDPSRSERRAGRLRETEDMPLNVKEMIIVLALSTLVFAVGKSTALEFMDEGDFKRRRNVWLILSAAAFLSPSFWIFALVAAPSLYIGGRKDGNPLAFYLLLMNVIPSIPVDIPTNGLGIQQLFYLDIFRLLSICVLVPAALKLRRSGDPDRIRGLQGMDYLLIGYGILTVAFFVPPDRPDHVILHNSFTNVLRDAFLFVLDIYLVYYVASRSATRRRVIVDALAAFCLSCTVMATVAVFESVKHWRLYTSLYITWGGDLMQTAYLFRAGLLRAVSSSGNALVLGYLLAIAFGFWLYLKTEVKSPAAKLAIPAVLWMGLLASFSRGPWLGAILIYFAYPAFIPRGASRLVKSALILIVAGGLLLASPIGQNIVKTLPFVGGKQTQAASSLSYREQLASRSWELILEHPFLGDQLAMTKMEDLRQGQGIIDLVNAYVGLALFHGLVGVVLFLSFILLALSRVWRTARSSPNGDNDLTLLAACLGAAIVGTLLMMAACSFILGYIPVFFTLAGLAIACSRLSPEPQAQPSRGLAVASTLEAS